MSPTASPEGRLARLSFVLNVKLNCDVVRLGEEIICLCCNAPGAISPYGNKSLPTLFNLGYHSNDLTVVN